MRCLASVPSGTPERRRASSLGGCRIGLPSAYAAVAASARTHRRPRDPRGVRRRDRRRSRPCARKRRSGLRVRRRFAVSNGIRERDDVHFSALRGYSTVAPLGKGDAAQKLFFQHGDNQSGSCTNVFMDKGVDPTFWAIYGITALCFGGAIIAYCRHPHVPFRVFGQEPYSVSLLLLLHFCSFLAPRHPTDRSPVSRRFADFIFRGKIDTLPIAARG